MGGTAHTDHGEMYVWHCDKHPVITSFRRSSVGGDDAAEKSVEHLVGQRHHLVIGAVLNGMRDEDALHRREPECQRLRFGGADELARGDKYPGKSP